MKPREQVIALAKACNWKLCDCKGPECRLVQFPDGKLYDPLSDLNAMHEAEKMLDADQFAIYGRLLGKHHPTYCISVLDDREPESDFWYETAQIATSTATERAEAFLRTIGKWIEPSTEQREDA